MVSECCKSLCKWKQRNVQLADLTKALLQGSRNFSIKDLQNRLNVFPRGATAKIAGKETEKICG